MRKKRDSEAGFTLVEMLAATAVMVLLAMMLSVGAQVASHAYRSITTKSEMEALLSSAMNALTDDLRYARDVKRDANSESDVNFTYTSDSYGYEIRLGLKDNRIVANEQQVLSAGAYGDGKRAYEVTKLTIEANDDNTFTITLTVQAAVDTDVEATRTVTVRCLNKIN